MRRAWSGVAVKNVQAGGLAGDWSEEPVSAGERMIREKETEASPVFRVPAAAAVHVWPTVVRTLLLTGSLSVVHSCSTYAPSIIDAVCPDIAVVGAACLVLPMCCCAPFSD